VDEWEERIASGDVTGWASHTACQGDDPWHEHVRAKDYLGTTGLPVGCSIYKKAMLDMFFYYVYYSKRSKGMSRQIRLESYLETVLEGAGGDESIDRQWLVGYNNYSKINL